MTNQKSNIRPLNPDQQLRKKEDGDQVIEVYEFSHSDSKTTAYIYEMFDKKELENNKDFAEPLIEALKLKAEARYDMQRPLKKLEEALHEDNRFEIQYFKQLKKFNCYSFK